MARIDSSDPGYAGHHDAVYADPRLTDLEPAARYTARHSTDGGRTWQDDVHPCPDVCGGHVQAEVAMALLADRDVTADGTTRTISGPYGELTRWTRS